MQVGLRLVQRREYWIQQIEEAWKRRSIVWLAGVRRAGKRTLCQSLGDTEYFDCERPRERLVLADPESFLDSVRGRRVVLDEIHRLDNPSELLKIAADHYPETKIVATGSSILGASKRFRDTLTGRKIRIHLPPLSFVGGGAVWVAGFGASDAPWRAASLFAL